MGADRRVSFATYMAPKSNKLIDVPLIESKSISMKPLCIIRQVKKYNEMYILYTKEFNKAVKNDVIKKVKAEGYDASTTIMILISTK
jgi:hypothetical protein